MGLIKKKDITGLFRSRNIEFSDINIYATEFINDGDFLIPLAGRPADAMSSSLTQKLEQFISDYDPRLIPIYRRSTSAIELVNSNRLGNPAMSGLLEYVDLISEGLQAKIKKMSTAEIETLTKELQSLYDMYMTEEVTGYRCKLYFWIPCHKVVSKYAREITLFKRITFIFS